MTDPRKDLAGAVGECQLLMATLAESFLAAVPSMSVSVADIAKMEGVSTATICRQPWRLPGFGIAPDASPYPARFWLSTYLAWAKRPLEERRAEWETMPRREKQKLATA